MGLGRIYISGKITGLKMEDVCAKFAAAEKYLRGLGYETVSPLRNGLSAEEPWEAHMAADLNLLLSCGSIFMLADWPESLGAQVEHHFARVQGKAILYEETPTMERLVAAVESVFDVQFYNLRGKDRKQSLCFARTVFAGVAATLGFTPSEIGLQIRRDRTTIIHYIHQFENGIDHSPRFARLANEVREKVIRKHDDKHSL